MQVFGITSVVVALVAGNPTGNFVPLYRVAEQRFLFSNNEQNPLNPFLISTLNNCSVNVLPPVASRYGPTMNLLLFFDGVGGYYSGSSGPASNSNGRRNTNNTIYAFRFTPDAVGDWKWELKCPALQLTPNQASSGTVTVKSTPEDDGRGGLISAQRSPQLGFVVLLVPMGIISSGCQLATTFTFYVVYVLMYEREDGSSFTSLGYEMDWLWALGLNSSSEAAAAAAAVLPLQPPSEPQAPPLPPSSIGPVENALDILDTPGHISWAEDAGNTPWDPAYADKSRLNLRYLKHWDQVLDAADKRGLVIHLMLYVGNKNVGWPTRLGESDSIYWHNVMARYAAHPAVILDVSKEAASYG
eukprot:gene24146-5343_t